MLPVSAKSLQSLTDVSITSSEGITLHTATLPTATPIRRMEIQYGPGIVLKMIGRLLSEADTLAGGRCTTDELELMSKMCLHHFRHRSVESLVLAIRDGMMRTDEAGKIYGKLTWTTLCVWLNDHEAAIIAMADAEHSRNVVKNDNLGADYMDRLQHRVEGDRRKLDRANSVIEELRRKLHAAKEAKAE